MPVFLAALLGKLFSEGFLVRLGVNILWHAANRSAGESIPHAVVEGVAESVGVQLPPKEPPLAP